MFEQKDKGWMIKDDTPLKHFETLHLQKRGKLLGPHLVMFSFSSIGEGDGKFLERAQGRYSTRSWENQ